VIVGTVRKPGTKIAPSQPAAPTYLQHLAEIKGRKEELIRKTIPDSIRIQGDLALPAATSEYQYLADLKKIAAKGQMSLDGRRWEISRALAGEWVQLERIEHRVLVYYCRSLVRELDLLHHRSTAVDRWWL